ncbi:hypothetical protein IV498_17010 [Paenarthrobacter sp. Z7-10]|uniref:hypothetical protein n=1 Tax=Paenarthrobacter sp. Z7-10 TaxID=2787635 RepID=UPI0022A96DC5|nr:hypothetical protein [Paenarthrobacter sp. Z7-10]MCZ2404828.1 hypothetical protein [Paenarthrobacter sp. Z7-10]
MPVSTAKLLAPERADTSVSISCTGSSNPSGNSAQTAKITVSSYGKVQWANRYSMAVTTPTGQVLSVALNAQSGTTLTTKGSAKDMLGSWTYSIRGSFQATEDASTAWLGEPLNGVLSCR